MFEITVVEGASVVPGTVFHGDRFPFTVGRAGSDLCLTSPGVWDRHFEIRLGSRRIIELACAPETSVLINGAPARETRLRGGDIIQCGAVRLEFSLTPPRPRSLAGWEWFVWIGLLAVAAAEAALAAGWKV